MPIKIGDKFNKWIVIGEVHSDGRHNYYKCQCSCGTIRVVRADRLRSGKSKSCGCLRHSKAKDIKVGDRFNAWKVLEPVSNGRKRLVKCQCECGTVRLVFYHNLLTGHSSSCGLCGYKSNALKKNLKEKEQKRKEEMDKKILSRNFGKLKPQKCIEAGRYFKYLCLCECGNTTIVRADSLLSGDTISCGCNVKSIMQPYLVDDTNLLRLNNKPSITSETGVRGVTLTATGKYKAVITCQKQRHYLGTFESLDEAKKARERAEEEYFKPMLEKYDDIIQNKKGLTENEKNNKK